MSVLIADASAVIYRAKIALEDFEALLVSHRRTNSTTDIVEALGRRCVDAEFANEFDLEKFVRDVCTWGNYPGIAGRVLRDNTLVFIAERFADAYEFAQHNEPGESIESIIAIEQLDVSFGSKHLRFLNPKKAVILDSIISEKLGFPRDRRGYTEFFDTCATIRDVLNEAGCKCAPAPDSTWRVCDVESAIITWLGRN